MKDLGILIILTIILFSAEKAVASDVNILGEESSPGLERVDPVTHHDKEEIGKFLASEAGREAEETYKTKIREWLKQYPIELPVTKDNAIGFLVLQKDVSPKLREAISNYLESGGDDFDRNFLACLSVSQANLEGDLGVFYLTTKDYKPGTNRVRFFSPLMRDMLLSGIYLEMAEEAIPEILVRSPKLCQLGFLNSCFPTPASFRIFDGPANIMPSLGRLEFFKCVVPEELWKSLSKMPQLSYLSLSYSTVNGRLAKLLKNLPRDMQQLILRGLGLTETPELHQANLEVLDLSDNPMAYPDKVYGLSNWRNIQGYYIPWPRLNR